MKGIEILMIYYRVGISENLLYDLKSIARNHDTTLDKVAEVAFKQFIKADKIRQDGKELIAIDKKLIEKIKNL